jgi:endonuclease G, mitochondrial
VTAIPGWPKRAWTSEVRPRAEAAELPDDVIAQRIAEESIALQRTRPVLAIRSNATDLTFRDRLASEIWTGRLREAEPMLTAAIPAIGRIDLRGGPLDWVGTG